jgi:hypothetical protein
MSRSSQKQLSELVRPELSLTNVTERFSVPHHISDVADDTRVREFRASVYTTARDFERIVSELFPKMAGIKYALTWRR